MREDLSFYIDGKWVAPSSSRTLDVINPANETVAGRIALGEQADVDAAVRAARQAFSSFSVTSREQRLDLLDQIISVYERRMPDLAEAVTLEMGAPSWVSEQIQVVLGLDHLKTARKVLADFAFDRPLGTTHVVKEPIGVCALITPWNWPLNLISSKVAPALAVGCTMVLKPSEVAPFSGTIYAEILHEAGVPAGVFNLVHGDGLGVGVPLSTHPDVDMVSFTGSTRAGIEVARNAASTVKRVHQELGGKSANIILPEADIGRAVRDGVNKMMLNTGQTCNGPSRMFVPHERMDDAIGYARDAVSEHDVGDPKSNARVGPVVSEAQWDKVQGLIRTGIEENATLIAGGLGRPEGLDRGYYVKPTIFANVTNDMTIAREEIFGPVVVILGYDSIDQAIELANDTPYGLAAYVHGEPEHAKQIAARLRTGLVFLNGAGLDLNAPFGGYKQSGNGREFGEYAFDEYMELKAVLGFRAEAV